MNEFKRVIIQAILAIVLTAAFFIGMILFLPIFTLGLCVLCVWGLYDLAVFYINDKKTK